MTLGPFRALDLVFEVETADDSLGKQLEVVFDCMRTTDSPTVRYKLETEGPYAVTSETERREFRSADEVLPWLLWKVSDDVLRSAGGIVLHGAAVVIDGAAVVLCGRSGAGKSTLVAALTAAGHSYLTDEAVILSSDRTVRGWTRPLALSEEARTLLAIGDVPASLPVGRYGERLVDPAAVGSIAEPGPWPLAVVFVLGAMDPPPSGAPGTARSVVELASHLLTPSRVDVNTVRSLGRFVEGVSVKSVERRALQEMVGLVLGQLHSRRSGT